MRLDKFIVNCGKASRSEVRKLVRQGRVRVNGNVASKSDMNVNETSDIITLDGQSMVYREFVYLMLHKPAGYVSATVDKKFPPVTDLVPEEYSHFKVFPVGRLDIDTEGLLLLTNDGKFSHKITSPKKEVYKTYFARLDKSAEISDITTFENGMDLGDFAAKPAKLEICDDPCEVYVSVCEGKFHQVKRMCEKVDKTVCYLKRIKIGNLSLPDNLKIGDVRELTQSEMDCLI